MLKFTVRMTFSNPKPIVLESQTNNPARTISRENPDSAEVYPSSQSGVTPLVFTKVPNGIGGYIWVCAISPREIP